MKRKTSIIIAVILFGPPVLVGGAGVGAWFGSEIFRERVYEVALLAPVPAVRREAAVELRDYPSKQSALALAAVVAATDKSTGEGDWAAREALVSLILISGEDFGAEFSGNQYNNNLNLSSSGWPEVEANIAAWTLKTFAGEDM